MKVLLSADYHIKLNTKGIPDTWAKNRFRSLFSKLTELESQVELHIVAGDWFDKLPSLEELELFYDFVHARSVETLIIPGNHEALKKDTTFLTYLKSIVTRINPLVRIIDDFYTYRGIDFIPYNKLKEFEKGVKYTFEGNILVTHVRGEIPPHVKPEINLDLFDNWKMVLAGDLHSTDNSQHNILYPGSPVTTSFHRGMVDTGVCVVDISTYLYEFKALGLPQLLRKTIRAGEDIIPDDYHHVVYEIEGDMSELATVADNELIDKKVVKRAVDTSLILSPDMSIEQEIIDYLTFILELPEETIGRTLKVFHDNIKNTSLV